MTSITSARANAMIRKPAASIHPKAPLDIEKHRIKSLTTPGDMRASPIHSAEPGNGYDRHGLVADKPMTASLISREA